MLQELLIIFVLFGNRLIQQLFDGERAPSGSTVCRVDLMREPIVLSAPNFDSNSPNRARVSSTHLHTHLHTPRHTSIHTFRPHRRAPSVLPAGAPMCSKHRFLERPARSAVAGDQQPEDLAKVHLAALSASMSASRLSTFSKGASSRRAGSGAPPPLSRSGSISPKTQTLPRRVGGLPK